MQPAISIVTISYNKGPYIEECLCSVLDQDCPDVQYIVVDAGSSDGSREKIGRYRERIDTVIEERDEGPADGLNRGFAAARAPIYGYLNADDRYVAGALDYVVGYFAAHPETDVLCGAIGLIDEHGNPHLRRRAADRFHLANYVAGTCMIGQQATFFRRRVFDAAGGFNIANRVAWDGELLVDMALAGARFDSVPRVLGEFRIYEATITGSKHYRERLEEYRQGIRRKLQSNGIKLYSPLEERLRWMTARVNPFRHARNLLVR
jgi:Glycosyltransferases, probably involved in cell wall biogenesis